MSAHQETTSLPFQRLIPKAAEARVRAKKVVPVVEEEGQVDGPQTEGQVEEAQVEEAAQEVVEEVVDAAPEVEAAAEETVNTEE